jgi:hypothetical protein
MGNPTQTEAVSPSPGPPLKDPPTSPPHRGMGAPWGDDGGPMGAGAALSSSGAAAKRRRPHHLSSGGCRGRRDTKLTHGQRLARRSSRCDHVFKDSGVQSIWTSSGPAPGMAGDRGDDLTGGTRPQQSGGSGPTVSSSSGLVHAQREGHPAREPRARERAAAPCAAGATGHAPPSPVPARSALINTKRNGPEGPWIKPDPFQPWTERHCPPR